MDAIIDRGEEREIKEFSATFLQDYAGSGCRKVSSSPSRPMVKSTFLSHPFSTGPLSGIKKKIIERYRKTLAPTTTRYIRGKANSRRHSPDWHIGAGGDT